jgi:hypothetical protein
MWGRETLVTQELALPALIARGVRVLTANGDDLTDDSDPSLSISTRRPALLPSSRPPAIARVRPARGLRAA